MKNFLKNIFNKKEITQNDKLEIISIGNNKFSNFNGNAYENDIYRSAVDSIARNTAKLKGSHIIKYGGERKSGDDKINRILQVRPNQYMSAYDLIYKMTTHYYLYNNAFAVVDRDSKGTLKGIYPINPVSMEYLADKKGNIYCKFLMKEGNTFHLLLDDVIHIKRHFNNNEMLGDHNSAILPTLDLAHTQTEGMNNNIKSSAKIRGLLKYNQIVAPEKLKEEKEAFVREYLDVSNEGGIAAVDPKADYIPLENNPISIDEKQVNPIKNKIYEYLGISEKIVNSSYNEDEWGAFYESVVEPLALQFSLEFTEKIFTKREQSFGNSILFESNRLQFASTKTKNDLIFNLLPMGILSVNEAREILNLASIDNGDEYIQSLNYVNKEIIDKYQMGGADIDRNKD